MNYKFQYLIFLIVVFSFSGCLSAHAKYTDSQDFERLPEEQQLIFRPKVKTLIYDDDVYAYKINNQLYFSLLDFIYVLNLAITFDEDDQRGNGWFLREDWKIILDLKKNLVISRGREVLLDAGDFFQQNKITYISEKALENLFSFNIEPDIAQQYINIETPYPLPLVAKRNRELLGKSHNKKLNKAIFPRKNIDYDWLDLNTVDIRLGSRASKLHNADNTDIRNSAISVVQGQALKHNAYLSSSYNNRDHLSSVVARLSKRSEDATLLGSFIGARSYSIGDTDIVRVPLMGSSAQELGVRVSNSPLVNNQFQTATISGDAISGWDVELYRNDILVGTQTVTDSSIYQFDDVQLFSGDNRFEVFFYGPQGEIRFENINLPVNSNLLDTQDNIYDVSLSLSNTQTFRKRSFKENHNKNPHLSALYRKKIGRSLAYLGLQMRDVEKDTKKIIGAGTTSIFEKILVDSNLAVDDSGEGAAKIGIRRNIKEWDVNASSLIQTDDYKPNNELSAKTFEANVNARRNFTLPNRSRVGFFSSNTYSENSNDFSQFSSEFGTSYYLNGLNLSNNLKYNYVQSQFSKNSKQLNNNFLLRKNLGNLFLRGGVSYNILDDRGVDSYLAQANYQPGLELSGDATYRYRPADNYSNFRLNFNHTNNYFRVTPFFEYNSDNDLYAGLNINFSAVKTPYSYVPAITPNRLIGKGLVSSFVYHDKNGNMIFDKNDEPLNNVAVQSINVRRIEKTNEDGYSLINSLPINKPTDITVDVNSLPDSFMITANQGISVLPEPGEIIEIEFPIHLTGEIDGTVSIAEEEKILRPAKGAKINLYSLNKKENNIIQTQAAIDGFFVASQIPPGKYLMSVSDETIKRNTVGTPKPEVVEIGYNGDIIYGKNIKLEKNKPFIPLEISYVEKPVTEESKLGSESYYISTQSRGVSRLAGLLASYAKNKASKSVYEGMQLANLSSQEEETYSLDENEIDSVYSRCKKLSQNAIPCSMKVIVHNQ